MSLKWGHQKWTLCQIRSTFNLILLNAWKPPMLFFSQSWHRNIQLTFSWLTFSWLQISQFIFYGVISSLDWGPHVSNASFKYCVCFFPIPSTVIDLVFFLDNFLPFLVFNLYIAIIHTHLSLSLSASTSLLKDCWVFLSSRAFPVDCGLWSQYPQVLPDYY